MLRKLLFICLLLLFLPFVSGVGVWISDGTVMKSSNSNTSYVANVDFNCSVLTITSRCVLVDGGVYEGRYCGNHSVPVVYSLEDVFERWYVVLNASVVNDSGVFPLVEGVDFNLTGNGFFLIDSNLEGANISIFINETFRTPLSPYFYDLDQSGRHGVVCSVTAIDNGTDVIGAGNYTLSNCRVSNATATYGEQMWYTNYSYNFLERNLGAGVINDTGMAIAEAVDWFSIFITVAAVVTLVLLIVLIVVSLRGAGLFGGGDSGA